MILALALCTVFAFGYWLVFFRFRWLQFSITWGFVGVFVLIHLLLVFMIGLRFVTPASTQAVMIQRTIQLVPRLPEPTVVTEVLASTDVPVRRGQLLFQFDRTPYEAKVRQLQAQLAAARQAPPVLSADVGSAEAVVDKALAARRFAREQQTRIAALVPSGAMSREELDRADEQLASAEAGVLQAQQDLDAARARAASQLGGTYSAIAQIEAELDLARYYLDNTALVAPEDGVLVNVQVRPGMVSGTVRAGAIATFICDADRFLLAQFFQENLKYVETGQPVEVAFDLYPGQIFPGKVKAVWRASGAGQLLPSGKLPAFTAEPADLPQGQFAVAITLDDPDASKFPIGAQAHAAIYTSGGGFAALRRVAIRSYSWLNFFYPIPF